MPRWITTDGLTMLLEALNLPCNCETNRPNACISEMMNCETPQERQELREACQKAGHNPKKKYLHPQQECLDHPLKRWWRAW